MEAARRLLEFVRTQHRAIMAEPEEEADGLATGSGA
jgi:hypothetical protein